MNDPKSGAIVAAIMSILRSLGVIAMAIPPVLAMMRGHDLAGLYRLVQGDALVPALTALVALGLMAWGAILRWQGHVAKQVVKAAAAPADPAQLAALYKADAGIGAKL